MDFLSSMLIFCFLIVVLFNAGLSTGPSLRAAVHGTFVAWGAVVRVGAHGWVETCPLCRACGSSVEFLSEMKVRV